MSRVMLWSIVSGLVMYIAIGMVIYSPLMFGNIWQKLKQLTSEDLKNSWPALGLTTIAGFVGMTVLYSIISVTRIQSPLDGAVIGVVLVLFAMSHSFNHVIYGKVEGIGARARIWILDSSNVLVTYALAGAIMGLLKQIST